MKHLAIAALFLGMLGGGAAQAGRSISCQGNVSRKQGTLEGRSTVTISEAEDGSWYLDMGTWALEGGFNQSKDPGKLLVNSWKYFKPFGLRATYDWEKRKLTFKYKYDSGFLGGGPQWAGGTFENCEELENDEVKPPNRSCAWFL